METSIHSKFLSDIKYSVIMSDVIKSFDCISYNQYYTTMYQTETSLHTFDCQKFMGKIYYKMNITINPYPATIFCPESVCFFHLFLYSSAFQTRFVHGSQQYGP